jgi:hypothetical protein
MCSKFGLLKKVHDLHPTIMTMNSSTHATDTNQAIELRSALPVIQSSNHIYLPSHTARELAKHCVPICKKR